MIQASIIKGKAQQGKQQLINFNGFVLKVFFKEIAMNLRDKNDKHTK